MAIKVKKTFGELPETVAVLADKVDFDGEGNAEVSEAVAEVLAQIPGYEIVETKKAPTPKAKEEPKEAPAEDTEEDKTAPKKPAPRKPAPKKA